MLGFKARRIQRELQLADTIRKDDETEASRRPDLIDAVREVLDSTDELLLCAQGFKVCGSQDSCTVNFNKHADSDSVTSTRTGLKKAFEKSYTYTIIVTASCPSEATQIRTMMGNYSQSYADETQHVCHDFKSNKELKRWLAEEGRITSNRTYLIVIEKRSI